MSAAAASVVTLLVIPACVCFTPHAGCVIREKLSISVPPPSFRQNVHISYRKINNELLSASSTLDDIDGLTADEIRQELQSYGIDTRSYFDKSELVAALRMARYERRSFGADDDANPSPETSTSPTSREEEIRRNMEQYKSLSVSELKSRLQELGVSTKAFFEKSDFVRALAEEDAFDPDVRDITPTKFRFDPYDKQFEDVLIDIGPDGKATAAPPPQDGYGRDDSGYNGYGKGVEGYGQEDIWDGSSYQGTSDDQKRWQRTNAAKGSTWAGSAWDRSGTTGSTGSTTGATSPPPPPPDEYQKRYEAGSSKKHSDGQVPFTERFGRSGNGVDSGWWEKRNE